MQAQCRTQLLNNLRHTVQLSGYQPRLHCRGTMLGEGFQLTPHLHPGWIPTSGGLVQTLRDLEGYLVALQTQSWSGQEGAIAENRSHSTKTPKVATQGKCSTLIKDCLPGDNVKSIPLLKHNKVLVHPVHFNASPESMGNLLCPCMAGHTQLHGLEELSCLVPYCH